MKKTPKLRFKEFSGDWESKKLGELSDLITKGTTIGILEIVEDYLANKKYYHDTILNAMNIQKKYIPDSMPLITFICPNSSTIRSAIIRSKVRIFFEIDKYYQRI